MRELNLGFFSLKCHSNNKKSTEVDYVITLIQHILNVFKCLKYFLVPLSTFVWLDIMS